MKLGGIPHQASFYQSCFWVEWFYTKIEKSVIAVQIGFVQFPLKQKSEQQEMLPAFRDGKGSSEG